MERIGILHPGNMGISVAVSAKNSGHQILWASEERSDNTRKRAEKYGLEDAGAVRELCRNCEIILCVCPPSYAVDVAQEVLNHSFQGLYADLNAISPQKAWKIAGMMEEKGNRFVDGGIIGGPAWKPGTTWLYLSGSDSERVSDCFIKGPLETRIIGDKAGDASALKMCYAAYTKGRSALLCAILGVSDFYGIQAYLEEQWDIDDPDFSVKTKNMACRITAKAWRFSGEMEEIAESFEKAGFPPGFHRSAGDIYKRMELFKERDGFPDYSEVLAALSGKK